MGLLENVAGPIPDSYKKTGSAGGALQQVVDRATINPQPVKSTKPIASPTLTQNPQPMISKQPQSIVDGVLNTVINTGQKIVQKAEQVKEKVITSKKQEPILLNNGVRMQYVKPKALPINEPKESGQSAQLKNNTNNNLIKKALLVAQTTGKKGLNVIDQIFKLPDKALDSAEQRIIKAETNSLNNKTTTSDKVVLAIERPLAYVQEKIIDPIGNYFQNTNEGTIARGVAVTGRGVQKGVVQQYLGSSKRVMDTFNTKLDKPVSTNEQIAYTVGDVVGNVLGFMAGGAVLKGIGLGKAAMPILFTTLGQTSSPYTTTALQRIEKAPVDAIAGWLFSTIPAPQNLVSKEAVQTTLAAAGVGSGQSFINEIIAGMPVKDAAEIATRMGIISGLFHIGGSTIGLFTNKIIQSKYREGTLDLTPEQLKSQVQNTDLNKTKTGFELIKLANQAAEQNKNIRISATAAKKSTVAKVLNLETPNGISFKAELIDGTTRINNNEYTPSEIRNIIIDSPLKDTPEGNSLMKASIDAEKQGKNVFFVDPVEEATITKNKIIKPDKYSSSKEEANFKQLENNAIELRDKYIQDQGNVISTDIARNYFKNTETNDVQAPAAQLKNIVQDYLLDTRIGEGNNTVLITAGGSGAGKTDALSNVISGLEMNDYPLIVDTTLASRVSDKEIQKIIDKGYSVRIAYVLRNPVEAWKNGVLPRTKKEGRVVTEGYHEAIFEKARQGIINLYEKFKDNPNVDIGLIDNTGERGAAKETTIDFVKNFNYDRVNLRKEIQNATEQAYKSKQITTEQYKAITKDRQGVASSVDQRNTETSKKTEKVIKEKLQNISSFKKGDILQDNYTKSFYEIVKINIRGGLAQLKNVETGRIEQWNDKNNKRFIKVEGFNSRKNAEDLSQENKQTKNKPRKIKFKRGDIKKLEDELDGLVGYSRMGEHWKQAYYLRNAYIEEAINNAPNNVKKRIVQILDRLDEIRNANADKAYKGGGVGAAVGDFSDLRNLSQEAGYIKSVQFPEIVRMVKEITGKYPEVWKKLRNRLADAQAGTLRIRMSADQFKNSLESAKLLAHELGHIADYLPEGFQRKGNLLSRIASLNNYLKTLLKEFPESEDNILTKKDRENLRKEAKKLSRNQKVVVEEKVISAMRDVTPQEILSIWNDTTAGLKNPELQAYIAKLSQQQKKDIVVNAIRGKVAEWVTYKHTEYKTVKKEVFKNAPEDIKKLYQQLLKEEIIKRRLHDLKTIRKELIALSRKWRPYDPQTSDSAYVKYRNNSSELYADAISVLFNDPVRLQIEAPAFYKAFFNYIDVKSDVAKVFFDTWNMLNQGEDTIMSERRRIVNDAFDRGEEKWSALRQEQKNRNSNFFFEFKYDFIDKNQKLIDFIKKAKNEGKLIPDDSNPEYLLNGRNYLSGRIKYMLETKIDPIVKLLKNNDLTMNQLDELLLYQRIMAAPERQEVANPYGLDKNTAKDTLENLKKEIGEERYQILNNSARALRNVMKQYLKEAYDAGMYSDDLYKQMADNPAYATFAVLDYLDTYISAHIYQTVGTLKEVASPSTATVMKMISTIRGIEHQKAKVGTINWLRESFPEEVQEAKKVFDGKKTVPIASDDENLSLIKYLDKGKVEGVYVDKYIATSLNYEPVDRINLALKTIRFMNGGALRPLYITFNLGFQTFNFARDMQRFIKNYPSKSLIKSSYIAIKEYGKALPPSFARAFDIQNKVIQEMEENKVLGITYNDLLKGQTNEDKQLEYLMKKYDVIKSNNKRAIYLKPFIGVLDLIERVGNMVETLPKVAGYQSLKGTMPNQELANFVRSYLGSPDFLKGGASKWWTNETFLFSNAITQGMRADYTIATQPRTRAGYWWKTLLINFIPKLLMFAAALGYFGTKLKKQFEDVSEYDKTNYIIVPFGEENNKTTYLRLPQDDSGRFFSGLFWKALNLSAGTNISSMQDSIFQLLSYAGGQFPSLTPTLQTATAISQYAAGKNPYDFYRGRNIIPQTEFNAGGMYRFKPFATWLIQNLGANIVLGVSVTEQTGGEKGWLQNLVEKPIMSNIVGRWVKVSNYGQTERNREIQNSITTENSQFSIQKEQALNRALDSWKKSNKSEAARIQISKQMIKDTFGKITKENKTQAQNQVNKLKMAIIKGDNDPNVNAIIDANTNKEKILIMQRVKNQSSYADYKKFRTFIIEKKIVSKELLKQMKKNRL